MKTSITDFHTIRPKFEKTQEEALAWIAAAHCQAERSEDETFSKALIEKLRYVACKPGIIDKRGHEIPDFLHENWHEMEIYALAENSKGASLRVRQEKHQQIVDDLFHRFYEGISLAPENMLHVTCTGYAAPSGAQKLVSRKGWETQVTHLYHMGCYAAIPALRVAEGFCGKTINTDVIHTELCTLHQHPELHDAAQLVVQSLFADGFIKYTVTTKPQKEHVRIIAVYEEIIPESIELMSWRLSDTGFQFGLSPEIPLAIAKHLQGFIKKLLLKANLTDYGNAHFAVHPGGPKILDYVQKWLCVEDEQLQESRAILKEYGNMSSATLPHIWQRILENRKKGLIVSLAFGPGLTLAGAILESEG